MKQMIRLNAELDIATTQEVQAIATQASRDAVIAGDRARPRFNHRQLPKGVIPGGNVNGSQVVINFGTPPAGHLWMLNEVSVIPNAAYGIGGAISNTPFTNKPANPAVNTDWSVTVPAGQTWQLQAVAAQLVASATVANRLPTLQILDAGGAIVWQLQSSAAQTAGQTAVYNYAGATEIALRNGVYTEPLPTITLGAGWTIKTVTSGLSAGDQWSNIVITYTLTTPAVDGSYPGSTWTLHKGGLPRTVSSSPEGSGTLDPSVIYPWVNGSLLRPPAPAYNSATFGRYSVIVYEREHLFAIISVGAGDPVTTMVAGVATVSETHIDAVARATL